MPRQTEKFGQTYAVIVGGVTGRSPGGSAQGDACRGAVEKREDGAVTDSHPIQPAPTKRPTRLPGLLLGLGLGGFVDGIVVHQLLQWHHMVSDTRDHPVTTVPGLEANTTADGWFHLMTWLLVLTGTLLMLASWRQGRLAPTWRFHVGLLLAGWGLFNLVEGVIDHQLLGVHHVRDDLGGPLSWDLGFLAFGTVLLVAGWLLQRSGADTLDAED